MKDHDDNTPPTGDELARMLSALSSPHRLRIVATLATGSVHVSQLAREIGLSRPLVHMHLRRLEDAGLVTGRLELSDDGKAMKFFEVTPFAIHLTPELVVEAAKTLAVDTEPEHTEQKETPRRFSQQRAGPTPRSRSQASGWSPRS